MNWGVEAIAAHAAVTSEAAGPSSTSALFARLMQSEIGEVNANVGAAEAAMRDLAAGRPVELHEVMITMERARISVQTFVHVRNKLVEAYQDLMRMQL